MSNAYYPNIDIGLLAGLMTIHNQMELHEGYLESKECPYDTDTKERLSKMFAPKVIEKVVEVEKIVERRVEIATQASAGGGAVGRKSLKEKTSGVDTEGVSSEIQDLRKELQQLKIDSKGLQTSDKISIIKTRAGLVEKLVTMDERVNNLKKMAMFQSVILNVLDDLVPDDRRLEFIKRITPFANGEA